jgi:hypothetical protein
MISDIAGIATAVGVLLALGGLRQGQRQRIRAFEDFYVSRYWLLLDRLSLRALPQATMTARTSGRRTTRHC